MTDEDYYKLGREIVKLNTTLNGAIRRFERETGKEIRDVRLIRKEDKERKWVTFDLYNDKIDIWNVKRKCNMY